MVYISDEDKYSLRIFRLFTIIKIDNISFIAYRTQYTEKLQKGEK